MLGPVQVWAGGRRLALDGAITETLLSALVIEADKVVPIAGLVDIGWGHEPPATVRRQVHNRLARLRTTLVSAGFPAGVITADGHGFVLRTAGIHLDLAQFHEYAHQAAAAPGPRQAVTALRTALGFWRGPAFGGLDSQRLLAIADQLAEQRLSAWERCLDLELQTGRHREVLAELVGLHRLHPARESLAAWLMLALYRCGRPAEALAVFATTRDHLAEELGVEPGPQLSTLYNDVSSNSPALQLRPPDASVQTARAVNQLPMLTPTFVGRPDEIAVIVAALEPSADGGPRIVALSGMAGIGKTTLAVRAARQTLADFPDGCLYTDLRGVDLQPADPAAVLGSFLRALGIAPREVPRDFDERAALLRTTTADRRLLMVLDNAHGEAQVRPLLPAGSGCAVIVTSRRTLASLDSHATVELRLFSTEESAQLLSAVAGAQPLEGDPDAVIRLVAACAGLPLAVRIIGARLAHQHDLGPRQLADQLTRRARPLAELSVGDLDVHATFMLSYQRLSRRAADLLHRLGVSFQLTYTQRTMAVLSGSGTAGVRTAVDELNNANLLTVIHDGGTGSIADEPRYRLHDLLRAFATDRAERTQERTASEESLRDLIWWYIDAVSVGAWFVRGGLLTVPAAVPDEPLRFDEFAEAVAWFDVESANLVAAVRAASGHGWHEQTWRLAYALRMFFQARHMIDEWLSTHQLGLRAAQELGDLSAQAKLHEGLSQAHYAQHQYAESQEAAQSALRLNEKTGDRIATARCHEYLGNALDLRGEPQAAEGHYLAALAEPDYVGDPYYATSLQLNLGALYGRQGRFNEAKEMFHPVLEMALARADAELTCVAHHNLAVAYRRLDRYSEGMVHARAEIEIAQRNRFTLREARGWEALGDLCADQGLPEGAEHLRRAMELYASVNDPKALRLRTEVLQALEKAAPQPRDAAA